MSDKTNMGDAPFDLDKLKQLVEMMETHDLTEVNLSRGDEQWRLRRGPRTIVSGMPQFPPPMMMPPMGMPPMGMQPPMPAAPAAVPVASAAPASAPAAGASAEAGSIIIKSPTVGTFYASPSPGEPAFISVGSVVAADTIVCLIEAMKCFNQIPAEVSGTITAVLAKNGDAIEFDQPLFRVKQ